MTMIKRILEFTAGIMLMLGVVNSLFAQTGDVTFVHDPCIIKSGDYYYIFSTGDRIEMRRSADMQNWTRLNQVFQSIPAWGVQEVEKVTNIWAPDIFYRDSTYYLYYSLSTFGSNTSRIGLATNKTLDPDSPDYKWIDQGKVIGSNSSDNFNAIDPNVAEDKDGRLWLTFGSFWSGIKIIELDTATMKPKTGASIKSIAERPNYGPIEAPYIIYKNGYYYLFVSFDNCCQGVNSTYKIAVGRSTAITGPYKDRNDNPMTTGGASLVLQGDERWKGPGHCAVLLEGENCWLVHHAYDAQNNGVPTLRIEKLNWDESLWPVVDSPTSIEEEPEVSGTYQLYQNYPNPFNPSTIIQFKIPIVDALSSAEVHTTLKVYDLLGREIATLVDAGRAPGSYEVRFDGSSLKSGVYFYRLQYPGGMITKKLLILK